MGASVGQHKTALDILAGVFSEDASSSRSSEASTHATVVDDFPELCIDKVNILSKRNEARTLATGVMHCTLQRLQTDFKRSRLLSSPSSSVSVTNTDLQSKGPAEQTDDLSDRLTQLLQLVYPRRCAAEPSFVADTLRRVRVEGREAELLEALLGQVPGGRPEAGHKKERAPAASFFMFSALQMQLAQLKHWHALALAQGKAEDDSQSYGALIASTCEGLVSLLEPMPLGSLSRLEPWEVVALNEIAQVLVEMMSREVKIPAGLALPARHRQDHVYMLYIALAIQRGSLHDLLGALTRLIAGEDRDEFVNVPDKVLLLLKRLSNVHVPCSFALKDILLPAEKTVEERFSPSNSLQSRRDKHAVPHEIHLRWEMEIKDIPRVDLSKEKPGDALPPPPALQQPSSLSTRHSTLRTRSQRRRLTVGDRVIAPADIETNPVLRPGDVGTIISDDRGHMPYRVSGPNGPRQFWFREGHLLPYDEGSSPAGPNGDSEHAEVPSPGLRLPERRSRQDVTFVDSATQVTSFNQEDTVVQDRDVQPSVHPEMDHEPDYHTLLSQFMRDQAGVEALAVSDDGRFLFICGPSVRGIVKVGTGLSSLEAGPTDAGRIYAYNREIGPATRSAKNHAFVSLAISQRQVLVFTRQRGSLHVACQALDGDSLECASPANISTFRLPADFGFFHEQVKPVLGSVHVDVSVCASEEGALDVRWAQDAGRSKDDPSSLNRAQELAWVGSGQSWLQHTGQWYFEVQVVEPAGLEVGYASDTMEDSFLMDLAAATKVTHTAEGESSASPVWHVVQTR